MTFTVGFITLGDQILLLHRNKAPNKGKWNGVGGHIEVGESPHDCMRREIWEETGLQVNHLHFGGILTWEGYEIERGGLYIFSAEVDSDVIRANDEGELAWHTRQFAFSHCDVVDNIHYFLPPVLAGASPLHYHFHYDNGEIVERTTKTLPGVVNIHAKFIQDGRDDNLLPR